MAEFSSLNGYTVKDTIARNIAKGRNQAVAFVDYATMIETLNELEKSEYKAGQNIYIGVVGVPDLWVYSVEDIRHTFSYVSDEDMVEKLTNNTTVQVGFFRLAMLEGQKVDLTTYDQHLAKHDEDIEKNADGITEINANMGGMEFSVQNGKPRWKERGADTWLPFSEDEPTMSFNIYQIGNRVQKITCDKDSEVTVSGLLSSANWTPAVLQLGNVHTFTTSGDWGTINLSGTYTLPAGSVITLTTSNPIGGDNVIYDGDGKLRSSYARDVTITIKTINPYH